MLFEMKKKTSGETLAKAAQRYIEAHSKEGFSLEQLAGALYINGNYLMRAFKKNTGMTPLNYHHAVRCNKAKELLLQTTLSISDIGEVVGFVSSSHFSHVFRKTVGCTPSEYRAVNKAADQEGTSR